MNIHKIYSQKDAVISSAHFTKGELKLKLSI